jgi:beta-lactamase regulating signal transducer with metallopeptidase domain
METFLTFLLKASIGIVLFYFFYYLVLRKETFYASNRVYLLAGLMLAILLPALPISYTTPIALVNQTDFFTLDENTFDNALVPKVEASQSTAFWQNPSSIFAMIYLLGAAFFLTRLVTQTLVVANQVRHGNMMLIDDVAVVDIKKKVMPFSFFNTVIINIKEYTKAELSNILAHEKVHIQERHWVDLLVIELLTVVFWINPVVWLYERSIKQNHEYLADQGVLIAGYHPGRYQALLINQLMGVRVLGLTNNLHFSLNKKRMEMMKKDKSASFKKMKLLLALPIIALLIFAFAKKEYSIKTEPTSQPSSEAAVKPGKVLDNLVYIAGEVVTLDGKPIEGAAFTYKGETFKGLSDRKGHFIFEIPKDFNYYESEVDYGNGRRWKGMRILVTRAGFANSFMLLDLSKKAEPMKVWMRQDITVTGRVISNEDQPMDGVNIIQKGTSNGTVTGANGSFSLESSQNSILVFSYVGYKTINYALSDLKNDPVEIVMKKGVFNIELPDVNDPNFKMQLPPPPPPQNLDDWKGDIYVVVEQMPYYQNGGIPRLALDLKGEIGWTKNSTTDRGETIVGFTVSIDSNIQNPHVVKSSGSEVLDDSAIKIITKLDNWWAGTQRGKRVPVDMTVPMSFE